MENNIDTLDLSGSKLKKLSKPANSTEAHISVLILDDNELQRLDNIDSFAKVQKLSAVRNQLLRMYGVCRLHTLHTLNLAHNGILTIEGLKELVHLKHLCLAGNNIKTIEHLNTNINLEHLDLSENSINHISDLSFLKNLKELLLNGNRIGHLRQCERYLPTSLVTLTLASNNIMDLNEISQLVHLVNLTNFSITNNPCVNMTGSSIGFDYRPFIINWCMNIKVIDGYVVDAIESLRAEWLYSQGRGRHFRIGDHKELTQYLASVCPLSGETLETEEDRKLRLILSKAQHHQQQLRDQLTTNGIVESASPSPSSKRRVNSNKNSPRLGSRMSNNRGNKSPDRMATSCYATTGNMDNSDIMSQSLDPKILSQSVQAKINSTANLNEEPIPVLHEHCLNEIADIHSPLKAATKLVPVPESLMSPDYRPSNSLVSRLATPHQVNISAQQHITNKHQHIAPKREQIGGSPKLGRNAHITRPKSAIEPKHHNSYSPLRLRRTNVSATAIETVNTENVTPKIHNSEEEIELYASKLQTIRNIAQERSTKKNAETNQKLKNEISAAVMIQKIWRGYHARNCNKQNMEIIKCIDTHRTEEHIQKLAMDMESTKAALESERKIQMLQMQAINALWKKVSNIQPSPKNEDVNNSTHNSSTVTVVDNNSEVVKDLAQTCSMLNAQVQQLQTSMQDVMRCMSMFCQMPAVQHNKEMGTATQTEIVAVHTPQGDAGKVFPFQKTPRPSSLPLPVSQRLKQNCTQTTAPQELKQYAGSLVDGVIKTVAETNMENQTTEITVTDTDRQTFQNENISEVDDNADTSSTSNGLNI